MDSDNTNTNINTPKIRPAFGQQFIKTTLQNQDINTKNLNFTNITPKEANLLEKENKKINSNFIINLNKKIFKFDIIYITIIIILSILLIILTEFTNANKLIYLTFLIIPISFIFYYIKRKQIKKNNLNNIESEQKILKDKFINKYQ